MGFSASAPRAPIPLAPGGSAEAPEARLWNAARAAAGRASRGSPLAAAAPRSSAACLRLGVGLGVGLGHETDRSAGRLRSSSAPASRRRRRLAAASAPPLGRGSGWPALNKVTSHGASPARARAHCTPGTTRRSRRSEYHRGRLGRLSSRARRRRRGRPAAHPRRRRFLPRASSGPRASPHKRDRRRLPLVLGAGPGDVYAARASEASAGDDRRGGRPTRPTRRRRDRRRLFAAVRAYRNRRAGTDARKNVSPPASGAPTSLRYTKTVHVRRSSRLWSWYVDHRRRLLGVFIIGVPFRLGREHPPSPRSRRVVVVVARGVRSSPRENGRAVRASITQSPSSFAGTPVKIAALRAGSRAAGICNRPRPRSGSPRSWRCVPRRGLVELPQSPGRGDERRTLLGRGESVHDSPCAARMRRARHEPRRGPGGQARRVITRGSYGNGNVSRKHVGWRGGVSARGRPSRVIALPRPRGRGTGRVVHQAKRVG